MTKAVSRLFDEYSDATAAMRDLEGLGISRGDINVVANDARGKHAGHPGGVDDHGDVTRGVSSGAVFVGAGGLLAGPGLLAIPGLGPIVAAGWLAATAAGAGIGAAGGGGTSFDRRHAEERRALQRGGERQFRRRASRRDARQPEGA